jgi:hypothetical protein
MKFKRTRAFLRIEQSLGEEGFSFLQHGIDSIARLLPHTEMEKWQQTRVTSNHKRVSWPSPERRSLKLALVINVPQDKSYAFTSTLTRMKAPTGAGSQVSRTLDERERDLCDRVLQRIETVLKGGKSATTSESLRAIWSMFDEQIVASHLKAHHGLKLDVSGVFRSFRELAEQSYENKSLTFGCLLDHRKKTKPRRGGVFPTDVLEKKRFRALSDGYRTAYRISTYGCVVGFEDLLKTGSRGQHFFPEWCEYLAHASKRKVCGVCLTRQGDILVFDAGTLRFTYRFGRWQYWNHTHIIDLLKNRARVQHVRPTIIGSVVQSIYQAALDVAFRRCGGLFILLRSQANRRKIARRGDSINDANRDSMDAEFDESLPSLKIQSISRRIMVELAGLDGAVVLNNNGDLLAYGAVLQPKKKGKIGPAEGSRTKAAIGASKYGLAVKISSDGDISFYENGRRFLKT